MQKPLDPLSVERTETPSASYVLRRRYGPVRHIIAVASWVTVINMLFQPVAVWAATVTWDGDTDTNWNTTGNWNALPANSLTTDIAAFSAASYGFQPSMNVTYSVNGLLQTGSTTITIGGANALSLGSSGITVALGSAAFAVNAPITLGAAQTWLNKSGNTLSIGGDINNATYTLTVGGIGNTTISSVLGSGVTKSGGLTKNDPGTLTLTAINPYTGATTINGGELKVSGSNGSLSGSSGVTLSTSGTLTLDNTGTGNGTRVNDAAGITLSGGTLKFLGNASAGSSETVGVMTLTASYASTVDIQTGSGQNATVTFASLSRAAGSAVNVKYTNNGGGTASLIFGTTAPTLSNSIVGGMFVNGADFATHGGTAPVTIAALALGSYTNPTDINGLSDVNNALINNSTTTKTLTASRSCNAMKIEGAQAIGLDTNVLTISSGMILKTDSGDATISGGDSLYSMNPAQWIVRVNEGTLTISSPVSMRYNGGVFSKSGPGLLILTPTGNWLNISGGDTICVAEGAIRLDPNDARFYTDGDPANIKYRLDGGVFELTADWSVTIAATHRCVSWNGTADGGFAAYGATRTVTLGSTLTWGTASHVMAGKALLFNSDTANAKIVMANAIDLAGSALSFREFRVADNTGSTADYAEITGIISGSSNLLKTGPGRLDLSTATSTYTGETIVKEGWLNINGTLDTRTSAVTVMSGATLGGTGTINRPVTVADGGHMTLSVEAPLKINGALTFNGSVDLTLTGTAGDGSITLIENDGAETVTFSNYTEGQTVNYDGKNYVFTYVGDDGNDVMLRPSSGGTVIMFR